MNTGLKLVDTRRLRRRFLKNISLAPASLSISALGAQQSAGPTRSEAPLEVAIDTVRLFNTMELHHYLKNGVYASLADLLRAVEAAWFTAPIKKKPKNPVYDYLQLGNEEIIAGWKLILVPFPEAKTGYRLSLVSNSHVQKVKADNTICVSDEAGIIYLGDSDSEYDASTDARRPAEVMGMEPIDVKLGRSGFILGVLKKFAFAAQGGVTPAGSCSCVCNCSSSGQCYCSNLGCRTCQWCCTSFCTYCASCTGHGCACCTN